MAIGSNNQYAAGPFQANDLIVNNQAMFSNPGMMALVAKEARKGTSGFFEIPNKERTEAPFLTAAKERVNQDLGLSPAVQGGMKNFLGESETVKDAPKNWKSSPNAPATELAYITDAEKKLLLDANLHDSLGDGMPNQGPSGIISLDGMGAYDSDSAVSQSQQQQYEQATSGSQGGSGGTSQSSYDTGGSQYTTQDEQNYAAEQNISGGTNNPTSVNYGQEIGSQTGISDGGGEGNLLSKIDQDQRIINELETAEKTKFEKLNALSDKEFEKLSDEQQSEFDVLNSKYGTDAKLFEELKTSLGADFEDGKGGVVKATTDTAKKIAEELGISLDKAKELLKSAGKKGLKLPMAIPTLFGAVMDKIAKPTEKSFLDNNYKAIMKDKYFNADGTFKEGMEKDFERFTKEYSSMMEGSGAINPNENILNMKDVLMSGQVSAGSDLERRLNPTEYYKNNPPVSALDFKDMAEAQAQGKLAFTKGNTLAIQQGRELLKQDQNRRNNLDAYKGGYQGPVVEKEAPVLEQTMSETPEIDPAVGTRDFASGQTYKLPMNYRAALTRDGEYGINKDPLSIAYTGGFNQMEDMDEYLKRIGKKPKNYLDADGNPIMTNAMGGL